MSANPLRMRAVASPTWGVAAQAMVRAAHAVAQPGGPALYAELVRELADTLGAASACIAVHADDARLRMRSLAAVLDGQLLPPFEYPLDGSPCAQVSGHDFVYIERGAARSFAATSMPAGQGMDSYAAIALNDSDDTPLGLLVVMDRRPIAEPALAEAMLKIFASRIVAEIARGRADEALHTAALAVSSARGDSLFGELARYLSTVLHCELAFIARTLPDKPQRLSMLAMCLDGKIQRAFEYALEDTPCRTVLGQRFRVYPERLREHFPDSAEARTHCLESYAGFPLTALDGTPLGVVAVASRKPLVQIERVESMLKIFAMRVGAEIERLSAIEAMQRSAASYRAIFEASEDAIFIHDWDSGAVLDVNPKACEIYGYSRQELIDAPIDQVSSGLEPYTGEQALRRIEQARLGRCPPFEWQRRNKDGSLHWDEVRLKPVMIDGRHHILAFTREITEHKASLAALQAREEQYRVMFDGSADALVLWDPDIRCVDVNQAFTRLFGWERAESIGGTFPRRFGDTEIQRRLECIHAALRGQERSLETQAVRKDGSRFDIEVRYLPIRYGGVPHVLSIGRDITERSAALAALQAQEQKYRAIFDGTIDSMVLWNSELRVVDINDAFVQMTGITREQVIGRHWSERPDADDLPQMLGLIEDALQGRVGQATLNVSRADGSRFEIELRYLPVRFGTERYALGVGRDVSERLERERQLRDSEAQYRGIFNASADALVLRDADFHIVDVNATYERMSGWSRDEVLGIDRIIANPPEVAQTIRAQHERALAGEPVALEVPLVRRDGEHYQLELRGVPILHRGQPHVLYMGRDVTERKLAERALRDSEEQYRAIFNASADALILWNSRIERVDVNRAYEQIYGWTRDEVIGHGYDQPQVSEAYARPRRELVQRALAGEACSAELVARRKNGEQILTEVHAIPFQHQGEPHVLAIARDITERKAAADALRMRERQYRAIFDGSADAMVLWNADIRFVDVNRAYTRMYGFTREEVIGTTLDGRLPPQTVIERTACIRAALAGEERVLETTTLRKNGESFFAELRYLPIVHLGVPHVLAIARDITERRAAEAQREALERQLHQAQKMEAIGQLTGGIAHDFNNILTSVIGYLVLGQERAESLGDAKLQRQLGQAHLAAQRARDLIAQMLAFARRQRGERRVLSLAPLVEQTLQLLRATLPSSLMVEFPGVGNEAASRVAADAVQLEQVLFNLCINARDAIQGPGSIRLRLGQHTGAWACASCRAHGDGGPWVALSVADTGSGIAPELIDRIFEPFTSTKEVGRGSGMGLAMVHGIVHDHGGHVTVETAPDRGSVFRLLLPPADPAAAPTDDTPAAGAAAPAAALRGRVMVVDDEATVGEFMAERLDSWGIDVVLHNDPLQALRWLEDTDNPLDLLISDQTMPQLTGLALAQRATALRPGLPVLLYSGNAEGLEPAELQRHGVCGLLRKPVDAETLRGLMQRCLEAGRQRAQS